MYIVLLRHEFIERRVEDILIACVGGLFLIYWYYPSMHSVTTTDGTIWIQLKLKTSWRIQLKSGFMKMVIQI